MKKKAKVVSSADNVATSISDIQPGDIVSVLENGVESTCTANQEVPFGHKIAVRDIQKGQSILKYGKTIGAATSDIKIGDWVHTHNVKDTYEVR